MTFAPLSPTQATDATAENQAVLNDVVKLGHRLTRLVVEQAEAGTLPATEATKGFERTSRDIRRCAWLVRKLAEPLKTTPRVAARKRLIREVEDTIQRHAEDPDAAEMLHEELMDRLDTLDLEDEIDERPIQDIITDIIRDLGLAHIPGTHPWKRRTPEDLAILYAQAAQKPPPIPRPIPPNALDHPAPTPNPPHGNPAKWPLARPP